MKHSELKTNRPSPLRAVLMSLLCLIGIFHYITQVAECGSLLKKQELNHERSTITRLRDHPP